MSPTQRAMSFYRRLGFVIGKTEQRIPGAWITRDLFNVIDAIAMKPGVGIVGVQVTSGSNHAARRKKAIAEPLLRIWLESGGQFEILSFSKRLSDKRGSRKTWQPRRDAIELSDLPKGPTLLAVGAS